MAMFEHQEQVSMIQTPAIHTRIQPLSTRFNLPPRIGQIKLLLQLKQQPCRLQLEVKTNVAVRQLKRVQPSRLDRTQLE